MKVMIYSNEHKMWWKPDYCGYTSDQDLAGIFDYEEACQKHPEVGSNTFEEDFFVKLPDPYYDEDYGPLSHWSEED